MVMNLCSSVSQAVAEPLAGSAPQARLWVLLEQPGPWGRDAVVASHLEPSVGHALKQWSAGQPVRLGLIRRVGRHADDATAMRRRTVLLARSDPGSVWLRVELVTDPLSLLDINLANLLNGSAEQPTPGPRTLLVCTNARRDRCCALLGRPLAARLESTFDGDVWETSHLGGHRFAPTLVSLPDGYLFGGKQAGALSTAACRGRSTLEPAAQVAELAALRHLGYHQPLALKVTSDPPDHWWVSAPGREPLRVEVTSRDSPDRREESCGKPSVNWQRLTATVID